MQIRNTRCSLKTPPIWVVATLLIFCAGLAAQAQETGLWGTLKDAESLEPLTGHVSIVHAARPNIQFFHAQASLLGMYEMNGLPPGEKIVIARAEGYGFAWKQVTLQPGEILSGVDFALEKAATLQGQVGDPQGLPVAGATVRLAYKDMPPVIFDYQYAEAKTDPSGVFRIRNVTPNRGFYLEVAHPRFRLRLSNTPLRAQPAQALQAAPLTLTPGVTFTGIVLDADGNPVAEAQVRLLASRLRVPLPKGLKSKGLERELHRVVTTDAEGRFAFEGLADGKRRLVVSHPQFSGHVETLDLDRTVRATDSLEVRLQAK